MAYLSQITYEAKELNSSLFLEVIREVLQVELINQKTTFNTSFLPSKVTDDSYLINPIPDKEFSPAWCSIIKAKWEASENQYLEQQNNMCYFIVGIMANGLNNLKKNADVVYRILNDMNVKQYLFAYENDLGSRIVSDSGTYLIKALSTEYEIKKTVNDKDVVYGNLVLQVEILEEAQVNTTTPIAEINTTHEMGENKKQINQLTEY